VGTGVDSSFKAAELGTKEMMSDNRHEQFEFNDSIIICAIIYLMTLYCIFYLIELVFSLIPAALPSITRQIG
jgi:hypothetical protein